MIIDKLLVKHKNWEIIREVNFSLWLNLIVDNDKDEKWNNVGKTTLLRCIDFCLWSKGDSIYKDKETGILNEKICSFLWDVEMLLCLTDSLWNKIILRRNFATIRKEKLLEINGINYWSLEKYNQRLNAIFYKNNSKLTFRSLIGKFIRLDEFRMNNILRFDHQTTTLEKYQLLHSYLFGFNNFPILEAQTSLRQDIENIRGQIKTLKAITGVKDEGVLSQSIWIYNQKIEELEIKIKNLKIEWWNIEILDQIKVIRNDIALLSLEISKINIDITFNQKSKAKLKNELKVADTEYIKSIYNEANVYIPALQKKFEDVIKFHNSIIIDRLSLVESSLKRLLEKLDFLQRQKSKLFQEELKLLNLIWGDFDSDLEVLREEQKELIAQKSKLINAQSILEDLNISIGQKSKHLADIEPTINQEIQKLNQNIEIFNKHFVLMSKMIADKELFLSVSYNEDGVLKFEINNLLGNDWSWEKKSQIAAFDFAYTDFANEIGLPGPKFILHDIIEGKDDYHLKKVFLCAQQFSWQYIVSIIKNRVSSVFTDEEIEKYARIYLNSGDKFFKLK